MKYLSVAAAFAACASISVSAQAQDSATLYVACMTHYGDNDRPNDVTPVAKLNWPSTQGTLLQINSAYFKVMQQRGERFYKAQCWGGQDADRALSGLNQWEEMSGYAKRPRREQALNDIFPAMFDEGYSSLSRISSNVSRASFSAIAVGSAIDGKENAAMARQRAKPATVERPPEKLEIASPSGAATHRMTKAEADAKFEAAQAEYRAQLEAQQKQVDDYNRARDEVARKKEEQRLAAERAAADYQKQLAAHDRAVRNQQLEYQKQIARPAGVPNAVYRGFAAPDCELARLSAVKGAGTSSATQFKEVTTETIGSNCVVQGWWWDTSRSGAARQ